MDDKFQEILDGIPEKPPRSTLEPYRELIKELRRRGRTYREIAHILAEKCHLHTAASTINRFLRKRMVTKAKSTASRNPKPAETTRPTTGPATESIAHPSSPQNKRPSGNEIQERIAALKRKPAPAPSNPQLFRYDPDEPLHLPPKKRKDKAAE